MGTRLTRISIALLLVLAIGGGLGLAAWTAHPKAQIRDAAIGIAPQTPLGEKSTPISSLDELTWAVKTPMPTRRYGAITGYYNNAIYVAGGGQDTTHPFNATVVERFNPATNSWTTGLATNPNPRRLAGSGQVQVGTRLYIIGGITEAGAVSGVTSYYDMATNTWTTLANQCIPRYAHGVAVLGTDIYVFGGTDGVSTTASAQKLNTVTGVWSNIQNMPASDGWMAGAAGSGKVYAFGGASYPNRVLRYDPGLNQWTQLTNMSESRVYATAVAATNGLIYLVGGESLASGGVARANAISFNPTSGAWAGEGSLPASRVWPAVASSATDLFVIGGLNQTALPVTVTNTCWQAALPLAGVPGPVTSLQVTVFDDPLGIFLEWVNPSVDYLGNVLTDLDSICIERYSCTDTVDVACLGSPVIGGSQTYVDDGVEEAGGYQWKVTPYNSNGVGVARSVSAFVGAEAAYTWESIAYVWNDISGTGTLLPITYEDQVVTGIPLGFTFNFYGGNYTTINISENGWLSFASTAGYYMNACLPAAAEPNNAIYPFFDDLSIEEGGNIYYFADGSKFIVQWQNVGFYDATGVAKFQIIIWASGAIDYLYHSGFTGPMNAATVGIEDPTGANYLQLCCNGTGAGCPAPGVAYRVNVACAGEGSISGTVTLDPSYGGNVRNVRITTDLGDVAQPSAQGEYSLTNVTAGARTLTASLAGFDSQVLQVNLLPFASVTGVNFNLIRSRPAQVTGLWAAWSNQSEAVLLLWSPQPDTITDQYCIYRCDPGSSTFALVACIPSTEDGYEDPLTAPTGVYQYYVTAKDLDPSTPRESIPSQIERASVGILPPFWLTADGYSDTRITLDWYGPDDDPVREYYYDDGTNEVGGVGFSESGYVAVRFTFDDTATIHGLRFYWTDQAQAGTHNKLYIWNTGVDGLPGTVLHWMNLNQAGGGNAFVAYDIDPPVVVPSGDFFVGVYQASMVDYLGLGADSNPVSFVNGTFYFGSTGTDWTSFEESWFFYTPMIRVFAAGLGGPAMAIVGPHDGPQSRATVAAGEGGKVWTVPAASNLQFGVSARGAARRVTTTGDFAAALQHPKYAPAKSSWSPSAEAKTFGHLDEADFYWVYRDGVRYDSIPPESTMTYDYVPENQPHTYWIRAAYFTPEGGTVISDSTNPVNVAANMPPGMVQSVGMAFSAYPACRVDFTWQRPTTNQDGTPCVDLAGYRVYRDATIVAQLAPDITTYGENVPDENAHTYMIKAIDEVPNESRPYRVPVLCEAMCNYNWIELVGDPDAVEITDVGDNDNLGFFPIGFPFEFYGETYLLFRFASNGFITFGSTSGAFDNQCPLPTTDGPNGAIYALWDDLDPSSGGTFWYKNDTENGRCIIEWSQVPFFGLPGTATFEIVLHQYGGIRLQYKDVAYFNGATIGIENQDGTEATEYCCNGFGDVCPMNEFCICMDCIPFGTLQGYVRQFPTNQPVPGAIVEVVATGQTTTANETGFYQMVVPCGSQQIRAMKEEFCTVTSTVVVACNAVTEQNFLLRKPRIQVQPDPVMAVCRNNMTCQDTFWVSNVGGRCPLEFTIEILGRNESGGWGHLDDVWLIVDPDTGSVGQDSTLAIYLTYDPDTMAANLNALLRIHHNAAGTPYELFVSLQVLSADIRQVGIPTEFVLYQNFPNPFNPVTSIFFDLPVREHVRLEIFNIVGQKVATLVDEPMVAGYHAVQFDAGNLPSGLYLYRVQAGEWTALKKMMLVK